MIKYRYLFILLIGLLSTGCSRLPMLGQIAPLPAGPICRVAVLPFLNESDYPLGDAIVTKVFAAQFQDAGNHMVIHGGDIFKVYQQLHILPGERPSSDQLLIITDRVKAQLLITGRILEMQEDRGFADTVNPFLFVEIQIFDGSSIERLWTTLHQRHGTDYHKVMHFGTIQTVTGLSKQMVKEIINLWFTKGLKQCDVSLQF